MTERSGSPSDSDRPDRAVEEPTSVFTPASERNKAGQDTTQLDRPGVPVGSSAPPWQRVPAAGGTGGSGGSSGSSGGGAQDAGSERPDDHITVAEHRPSYPPPVHGASNVSGNGAGSSPAAPNPFLTRGAPPVQQGHSAPMAGPGPIPVGGQPVPAANHPGHAVAGAGHAVPGPGHAVPGAGHAVPGAVHRPPPSARPSAPRGRPVRAPRKASLQIRRFDPWSVLKLSLVLSVAMFLMWLVAVGVLYGVLDGMGVWDKINGAYSDLASVNDTTGSGEPLISAGRVFGVSAVIGVVNIVLFTAFATVAAFVYNVSADLAGGIEVTLSERD